MLHNYIYAINEQTKRQNYTKFRKQLSLNSIGQSVFELESGNKNVDGQTNGQKTDKQTELHQFRKEPSYDGDLCPCQV